MYWGFGLCESVFTQLLYSPFLLVDFSLHCRCEHRPKTKPHKILVFSSTCDSVIFLSFGFSSFQLFVLKIFLNVFHNQSCVGAHPKGHIP